MNTKISSAPSASKTIKVMAAIVVAGLCASATAQGPGPAQWQAVTWSDLPGWGSDDAAALWPALRQQCSRPRPAWAGWCQSLPAEPGDSPQAHLWLMATLQPYRVQAADGDAQGLLTGYFEPQLNARRHRDARFTVPLLDTRQQPLLYLEDPLDAVLLQVQGSGRVMVTEADGSHQPRRVVWAGDNAQPFRSLARWLLEQGALRDGGWRAVRAWALQNPERLGELLAANPRVIYFREEALSDPTTGPRGAMGWPLTPGRSVAVDPRAVPYGTPLWLDSTQPLGTQPMQRLVLAQDTGSAIRGAVRADFFWGWGEDAFLQASRTRQALRWWALWPKEAQVP